MKAPSAHPERPSMDSARRRSWKTWVFQEWGLIILAAVLAVIIWEISSTQVIREQRIDDIRVELVIADEDKARITAVLDNPIDTISIAMTCSERERYAIASALTEAGGGTKTLRILVAPEITDASRAIQPGLDRWLWPVANAEEIDMRATMPPGRVYRIDGVQQVGISTPPTLPDVEGLRDREFDLQLLDPGTSAAANVQVVPSFVEFLAPRMILGRGEGALTMQPDPIDLRTLLGSDTLRLGEVMIFELSFTRWRNAELPSDVGYSAEERRRVRQFRNALPPIKATAKLALQRQVRKPVENRLEALLHPRFTWSFDSGAPLGANLETTPYDFKGTLVGPADVLDEVIANKDKWTWAIAIRKPDEGGWPDASAMADADKQGKVSEARIVWVPENEDWIRRGVRFEPDPSTEVFYVKVNLRK